MTIPARYLVDSSANIGSADIFINNELTTTYSYDDGLVTLSSTPVTVVLTLNDLDIILNQIKEFLSIINRNLSVPTQNRSEYTQSLSKKNNKLEVEFKVDNDRAISSDYNYPDLTISFKPRSEIIIKYIDFQFFHRMLRFNLNEAINF